MKKLLRVLPGTLLLWLLVHCGWTLVSGLHNTARSADCLLVPGNTVNPDGTLSARLQGRLDKALELYRARMAPKIMVSGGLGREGHYEGFVMGQYLRAQGVPADDIIVDDLGVTTAATADSFAAVAAQRHFRSVLVVSQFYHLPRCRYLLRQRGFRTYTAHAAYYELRDVYSLLREAPAYYAALLK